MQTFFGMILGALLLTGAVYIRDTMVTSSVANGQAAQSGQPLVNWEVANSDWNAMKARAHDDWVRLSSR